MRENEMDFYKDISIDKEFFINVILQEKKKADKLDMSMFKLNKIPNINLKKDTSLEDPNFNYQFQDLIRGKNEKRIKKTVMMDSTIELLKLKEKNLNNNKLVEQYVEDTLQSKFYRFKKSAEIEKQNSLSKLSDKNSLSNIFKNKGNIKKVRFKENKSFNMLNEIIKQEKKLKKSFKTLKLDRYENYLGEKEEKKSDNSFTKSNVFNSIDDYYSCQKMKSKEKNCRHYSQNYNTKHEELDISLKVSNDINKSDVKSNCNFNLNQSHNKLNLNFVTDKIGDNEVKFTNTILSDRLCGSPDKNLLEKDILKVINDVNIYKFSNKNHSYKNESNFKNINDENQFTNKYNTNNISNFSDEDTVNLLSKEFKDKEFDILEYLKSQNLLNTEKLTNFSALDNYLKKHCCNRKHINYDKFFPILENETNLKFPFIKNIGDLSRNMKFKTKLIYKNHDIELNSMRQVNCNVNSLPREELINRIIKRNVKIIDIPVLSNSKNNNFSNYDKIPVTEILNVSDNLIKSFDKIHEKFKRNFDERNKSIIQIMKRNKD